MISVISLENKNIVWRLPELAGVGFTASTIMYCLLVELSLNIDNMNVSSIEPLEPRAILKPFHALPVSIM